MIEIKPQKIVNNMVTVPGSKSYTHRVLITAALSDGICTIENCLKSEDTALTQNALKQMGVRIEEHNHQLQVYGTKGELQPSGDPVFLGNSGTSMRLLTSVAALAKGTYTLTGTSRMKQRPIQDLLDGLNQIGVLARCINNNDCPPVEIQGGTIKGGRISLNCNNSSQYLSSLLLIAPCTQEGLEITVTHGPVSKPYVDMTIDIMARFGITVTRDEYTRFQIAGSQAYRAGSYMVEPDCSQAGYFWAAAAITGATVTVQGITKNTRQGDIRFTKILEAMGCKVAHQKDGIAVTGDKLSAIEVDMADMPDLVPTLSVVAAFAQGATVIRNVAHLKAKESDRLGSVVTELKKMGIQATATDSDMIIQGGRPAGAVINTYNDHRIAMSFALAGLVVPGVIISDEKCVGKSFPDFWKVFGGLFQP
ncbi:MAG: 3-phosphoshikimate 1-carboxyvinyltransferase [Deltaproteobacteria bacterium CG1_02_45_11]|nr:MAG: 3-phosphoshikimate 1-carboxyvinyltransferase [Deltaproteobacteria bacterium CG1_02_45_11]